jgi:hypothetical protein
MWQQNALLVFSRNFEKSAEHFVLIQLEKELCLKYIY